MSIIRIVLISLLSLILVGTIIAYTFFAVIFWKVRNTIKKTHKLQFQFNNFSSFNFKSLVKPVELLIKNHEELKPVVVYIQQFNNIFQNHLQQVIGVLKTISIYDNHYDIKNTKKIIRDISTIFDTLDKMVIFFSKFSMDTTSYQISSSNLIINFRKIIDAILLFLHQHVLGSYDNNILKKCVVQISVSLIQLNERLNKLMNQEFINIAEKLSQEITYLEKIVKSIYSLDLKLKYLRIVHHEVDIYVNRAEAFKKLNYSNAQINEIKNTIEDGRIILDKIHANLYLFQFQTASKLSDYLFEKVVLLKKQISADAEAFSVVNKNLTNFNSQIKTFENNFKTAVISLQVIKNNFAGNQTVNQLIVDAWKKMDEINNKITTIKVYEKSAKQHHFQLLKYFIFIVDNIIECQEIMESLIKTITAMMEEFKHNIQEVNNLKLLFAQLRAYMIKEKLFLDQESEDLLHEWEQKINDKNDDLTKDYAKFSENIEDFLKQAHIILKKVMKKVVEQENFKVIAVSCIAFINKYTNEHTSIFDKQKELELLFVNSKYEKIIKKSIKIIEVIKQSALENDITLQ